MEQSLEMDVDFDNFATSEPEAPTIEPMMDEEIVGLVCTENDAHEMNLMIRRRKFHLPN